MNIDKKRVSIKRSVQGNRRFESIHPRTDHLLLLAGTGATHGMSSLIINDRSSRKDHNRSSANASVHFRFPRGCLFESECVDWPGSDTLRQLQCCRCPETPPHLFPKNSAHGCCVSCFFRTSTDNRNSLSFALTGMDECHQRGPSLSGLSSSS